MFRREEIEEVRRNVRQGQAISIATRISKGAAGDKIIRTMAVIDGVYPHGIMVSFRNPNKYGTTEWLRRWIDYVDILQCKGRKSVYARSGRREECYYGQE